MATVITSAERICTACQSPFVRARRDRPNHKAKRSCCDVCIADRAYLQPRQPRQLRQAKHHLCAHCAAPFSRRAGSKCQHCDACVEAKVWLPKARLKTSAHWLQCAICGADRLGSAKSLPAGRYTCHSCRRSDPDHIATVKAKRKASRIDGDFRTRARHYGVEYEPVSKRKVFARDGWRCGICGVSVDKGLSYPDPMSASLDHIVPLSVGGAHTHANVQCAHLRCNVIKGNRAEYQSPANTDGVPTPPRPEMFGTPMRHATPCPAPISLPECGNAGDLASKGAA